jgi:hypothetical protein
LTNHGCLPFIAPYVAVAYTSRLSSDTDLVGHSIPTSFIRIGYVGLICS